MRLLFLGDIVGEAGRAIAAEGVRRLRPLLDIDVVIANAENSAGGSGMTSRCYKQLRDAGIDGFTMGDHIYRQKEIYRLFDDRAPICKPANYPPEAPGQPYLIIDCPPLPPVAVISVIGRMFMKPVDCPFRAVDRVLKELADRTPIILVDMHAEATSEKQLMVHYLKGRVSAVVGTHTHVPTADAAVLPPGTAFITDVGMNGPYDSILGRKIDPVMQATIKFIPRAFDVATGDPRFSGVLITIDEQTGRAIHLELLQRTAAQLALPTVTDGYE